MARKRSLRPGIPEHNPAVGSTSPEESPEVETQEPQEEEPPVSEEERESSRQTITARCQEAKESGACACRCRGKYHGAEHPEGWKDEVGCEPLTPEERKLAKKDTLNAWRRAHKDRVKEYMAKWRATSNAPTAVALRMKAEAAAARDSQASQADPQATPTSSLAQ